jgi:hypothetical protein
MKAQVLHKYDPEMKEKPGSRVKSYQNPKIRKIFRCNS